MNINYRDYTDHTLQLRINLHPGDDSYLATIEAGRACNDYAQRPFYKSMFGATPLLEEGKDYTTAGYGTSCAGYANRGAVTFDGTIIQEEEGLRSIP